MGGSSKTSLFKKTLWTIAGAVVISVITAYLIPFIKDTSPEVIVRQFYNTVEKKAVPKQVGGLIIDYQQEVEERQSIYLVEVSNEGKGPEEDLRVQVNFPRNIRIAFHEEPDFRVYGVEEISLKKDDFFMSFKQFPSNAVAPVAFEFGAEKQKLCEVQIKVAGKKEEGQVEEIKGVRCE